MCGIAGFLQRTADVDEPLERLAQAMADTLTHRGPDDSGAWADPAAGIALGHRRLSIIDLSAAGHQPMLSANGRFVISYNGEIYNHGDLRKELESQGAAFRGHSDTEVIVEGFAR
ncbi:MAG: asparagine synthetase B, partial [Rhodospirillaceae bacterium]|nr:asparagine synthetase B [Rhodospirillaceae bacterium]